MKRHKMASAPETSPAISSQPMSSVSNQDMLERLRATQPPAGAPEREPPASTASLAGGLCWADIEPFTRGLSACGQG
jgi:hypothetical protein